MCQCPDGSFASMGVPCRRAPAVKKEGSKKTVDQVYCGTAANSLSYFCPAGTTCTAGNLKSCTRADGKTQAAISRRLTAAQRQAAESQKKAAERAAEKIKAEQARTAAAGALDAGTERTAKAAVAAGLVDSVSKFAELGKKAQGAIPTQSLTAGLRGWTPGAEQKGERPEGRGYCTDYVRAIWPKITGKPLPAGLGDAGQWYEKAQQAGLKTAAADAMAKVPAGSIAVWSDGKFGHVAVVVRNDGTSLHITEANWGRMRDDATEFEKKNMITKSFNKHEERTLAYADARERDGGTYKLVGFIVPD